MSGSRGTMVAGSREVDALRGLARLLDEAIRIPGTNVRVGLDALIGLIPGAGDVAGGLVGAIVLLRASRLGAPTSVLTRMLGNIGIDAVVGAVPLLGDLFDVGFKATSRNVRLLEKYLDRPTETRRASRLAVAGLILVLALVVIGGVMATVFIVRAIAGAIS